MAKKISLPKVTYSRSFQSERETPVVLIGGTRWAQDLELLLEDAWPALSLVGYVGAADEIQSRCASLALVHGTDDVETVRACIEGQLPSGVKKVIILNGTEGLFVRRTYVNYGARCEITVVELSSDAAEAGKELSGFMHSFMASVADELTSDIEKLELIVDGFQTGTGISSLRFARWNARLDLVLGWMFPLLALETVQYKLIRVLARATPLFEKRTDWAPSVADTLSALQSYASTSVIKGYLDLAISLADRVPPTGVATLEDLKSTVSASSLGLLTKRALTNDLVNLISGTGRNKLSKVS